MFYDLYRIYNTVSLLYDSGRFSPCKLDNRPMDAKIIKVYKGVDNKINFKLYDSDKKKTSVDHLTVKATMINHNTKERVFIGYCNVCSGKGAMELIIGENDLMDVAPGFYDMVIVGEENAIPMTDGYVISTPFYTDPSANAKITIEVLDAVDSTPTDSILILPNNWSMYTDPHNLDPEYISGAYPANRLRNSKNGSHTIAIYFTNFTGEFEVFGSLDHIPSQDINDFFPLSMTNMGSTITYTNYSGIDAYHFEANVIWLKFRYKHDNLLSEDQKGTLDKLYLRS